MSESEMLQKLLLVESLLWILAASEMIAEDALEEIGPVIDAISKSSGIERPRSKYAPR